ncbi:MAG TPA: hypothetical protein VI231_22225 [Candidatus Binatia bacterium]|jgi:hypothetical protein
MTVALDRPVKRLVKIGGLLYIVEMSAAGILFRRKGSRTRVVIPWFDALGRAEIWAARDTRRAQLAKAVLKRGVQAPRS